MIGLMRVTATFFILILVVSCSDDSKIQQPRVIIGSGNPITETRTLPGFHSVDFQAAGDVSITSGTQQEVKITVDDNLLEYLETTVTGSKLVIGFDDAIDPDNHDLLVELTMSDLQQLDLTGVGDMDAYAMTVGTLVVNLTGVGNTYVSVTDHLTANISGVGSVFYKGNPQIDKRVTGLGDVVDGN